MPDRKCPFSIIQAAGSFTCGSAQEVIRRGGSEYDCTEASNHAVCNELVVRVNSLALPALGHEDDLTLTPKSVYERILLGGLTALDTSSGDRLESTDIWTIVQRAHQHLGGWDALIQEEIVPTIKACKIRRRRRR